MTAKPPDDGARARRDYKLRLNVLAGLLGRGAGTLVTLVTVPLTINLLGRERYGLYVTIGAVAGWIQLGSLGLGKGLTNALIECHATGDEARARRHVASLWAGLAGALLACGVAAVAAHPFVPWLEVFPAEGARARREVPATALWSVVFALAGLAMTPMPTILSAYQDERKAVGWNLARSLALPAAALLTRARGGGMADLALATGLLTLGVNLACLAWLLGVDKPFLRFSRADLSFEVFRAALRSSAAFFLIDVSALLVFQIDKFLIAQYASPGLVTEYELASRIYLLAYTVYGVVQAPLWAALGEAVKRGDMAWVRRVLTRVNAGGTLAMAGLCVAAPAAGPALIRLWTGRTDVVPSRGLFLLVGAYFVVRVWTEAHSVFLFSIARQRDMLVSSLLHGAATLGLGVALGRAYGLYGIVASNTLSFLLTAGWWVPYRARYHMRALAARS